MFLAIIGSIIVIVGFGSETGNLGTIIIGLILIVFGLWLSTVFSEQCRAHANWRKHWSEK